MILTVLQLVLTNLPLTCFVFKYETHFNSFIGFLETICTSYSNRSSFIHDAIIPVGSSLIELFFSIRSYEFGHYSSYIV